MYKIDRTKLDYDLFDDEEMTATLKEALDNVKIDVNGVVRFGKNIRAEPIYGGLEGYRIFIGTEQQYSLKDTLENIINEHLSLMLFPMEQVLEDFSNHMLMEDIENQIRKLSPEERESMFPRPPGL